MANLGPTDYTWLDVTSEIGEASCFTFFDGQSVEAVAERTGIQEWRVEGPRVSHDQPSSLTYGEEAVFSESGWTIMYEPNGYPDRLANKIAASPEVARCVLVFWNVNGVIEFAYWERGTQIVSFDWPQDRIGADPDRLLAEMRETTGLDRSGEEGGTVFGVYQQMLALAERITGVRLGPDFLDGRSVIIGSVEEDDEGDEGERDEFSYGDDDGRESFMGGANGPHTGPPQSKWVEPGTGGHPEWVPDERRANEQALAAIPKDRWAEIPARLARLACEGVRIADRFPVDEILDDLDHGRRPHPARMTIPMDIYAMVEGVTVGWNAVPTERVWAAIETVFAAAKAKSKRSPLEVLLQARVAMDDHGTRVVDELRAEMDLL